MAELDWAAKLSLTVGLCAGRLGSTSGWGDGGLQMRAYAAYALQAFKMGFRALKSKEEKTQ